MTAYEKYGLCVMLICIRYRLIPYQQPKWERWLEWFLFIVGMFFFQVN
jgi:hypothetical protein